MGKLLLTVFAGLAELKCHLSRDRTEDGRITAKKRGVKSDRRYKLTDHQRKEVMRMLGKRASIRGTAHHFNVGERPLVE